MSLLVSAFSIQSKAILSTLRLSNQTPLSDIAFGLRSAAVTYPLLPVRQPIQQVVSFDRDGWEDGKQASPDDEYRDLSFQVVVVKHILREDWHVLESARPQHRTYLLFCYQNLLFALLMESPNSAPKYNHSQISDEKTPLKGLLYPHLLEGKLRPQMLNTKFQGMIQTAQVEEAMGKKFENSPISANYQSQQPLDMLSLFLTEVTQIVNRHKQTEDILTEPPSFDFPLQNNDQSVEPVVSATNFMRSLTPILQSSPQKVDKTRYASNTTTEADPNQSHLQTSSKKMDPGQADQLVRRLYDYQSKAQEKLTAQKMLQRKQENTELMKGPRINQTKNQSPYQSNRQPLYMRVDEELKKKQRKIEKIKQETELHRRARNQELGIEDEDEIIEKLKQKQEQLKSKISLDEIQYKYELQMKIHKEKLKKRDVQKEQRERQYCSFSPALHNGAKTSRNSGSSLQESRTVEERLLDRGKQFQLKQDDIQRKLVPTFQPILNKHSAKKASRSRDKKEDTLFASNEDIEREFSTELNNITIDRLREGQGQEHLTQFYKVLDAFRTER